jgi:short-subunit dehydrogenase
MVRTSKHIKKALITGASLGIGAAFAKILVDKYRLILVSRSEERLTRVADKLKQISNNEPEILSADLTKEDDIKKVEEKIKTDSDIELLINNAGSGSLSQFHESDISVEISQIDLNITALVRLTHAALKPMIVNGKGYMINVSSIAGIRTTPYFSVYGATKAFVKSFTEALHEELRNTGVYVQVLLPGFTRTDFHRQGKIDISSIPEIVWSSPEDVVRASLKSMEKKELVCIPGSINSVLASISKFMPSGIIDKWTGSFIKNNFFK